MLQYNAALSARIHGQNGCIGNPGSGHYLMLFNGTMPTYQQFKDANCFNANGQFTHNAVRDFLSAQNIDRLGYFSYASSLGVRKNSDVDYSLLFGAQNVNMTIEQTGEATWFMLALAHNAISSSNYYGLTLVGTVGAVGSNKDLEMTDTDIILGNPYRMSNMKIHVDLTSNMENT